MLRGNTLKADPASKQANIALIFLSQWWRAPTRLEKTITAHTPHRTWSISHPRAEHAAGQRHVTSPLRRAHEGLRSLCQVRSSQVKSSHISSRQVSSPWCWRAAQAYVYTYTSITLDYGYKDRHLFFVRPLCDDFEPHSSSQLCVSPLGGVKSMHISVL